MGELRLSFSTKMKKKTNSLIFFFGIFPIKRPHIVNSSACFFCLKCWTIELTMTPDEQHYSTVFDFFFLRKCSVGGVNFRFICFRHRHFSIGVRYQVNTLNRKYFLCGLIAHTQFCLIVYTHGERVSVKQHKRHTSSIDLNCIAANNHSSLKKHDILFTQRNTHTYIWISNQPLIWKNVHVTV